MILEVVLGAFSNFLAQLIGMLPTGSWSPDLSAVATFVGWVKSLDAYFPITEYLLGFAVAIVFTQSTLAWDLMNWAWRRVRG